MRALWLLPLVLLLPAPAERAAACCPAFPPEAHVQIADQEVLVVWEPEARMEHFVRRAGFRGAEGDFGFLVPTPTQPQLAEANAEVFDRLRQAIEPEIVVRYETRFVPSFICLAPMSTKSARMGVAAPAGAVRVLDHAFVAGYEAVVLEADDPRALTDWLQEHGYAARPALLEWVRPYVEQGWKVTAFKYAAGETSPAALGTQAVRLSFATERPLFPYRVPSDQIAEPGAQNLLRLFFVGPQRVRGTLGGEARDWPAQLPFADRLVELPQLLRGAVPQDRVRVGWWLSAFEDRTWPSGTEDLFFSEDPGEPIVPPPVVVTREQDTFVPLEPFLLVAALGIWWWRRRAKA